MSNEVPIPLTRPPEQQTRSYLRMPEPSPSSVPQDEQQSGRDEATVAKQSYKRQHRAISFSPSLALVPTCLKLGAFHAESDEDGAPVSPGTFPTAEGEEHQALGT